MIEEKLRNQKVEENLGLVHACANKFRGKGVEYEDLFQAGCVGLIKAADKFDESRGFNFSTYAVPVILGEIKRIFRDGGSVKVGRSLKEKSRKLMREKERFSEINGYEPTIGMLAEIMDMDAAEIAELLNVAMPTISLTSDDENFSGQIDIPVESPDEEMSDLLALEQTMDNLSNEDRMLIRLRYYKGFTQSKTAKCMGISQVQVSRKEKKILTEMRKKLIC